MGRQSGEYYLLNALEGFAKAWVRAETCNNRPGFKAALKKAMRANGIKHDAKLNAKSTMMARFQSQTYNVRLRTVDKMVNDCKFTMAIIDKEGRVFPFKFTFDEYKRKVWNATAEELFQGIEGSTDSVHESEGVDESE